MEDILTGQASTIDDMTVAEVRKSLALLRKEWSNHSAMHPICPSAPLINDMSMSEFCFRFVMGHHHKRHQKSR